MLLAWAPPRGRLPTWMGRSPPARRCSPAACRKTAVSALRSVSLSWPARRTFTLRRPGSLPAARPARLRSMPSSTLAPVAPGRAWAPFPAGSRARRHRADGSIWLDWSWRRSPCLAFRLAPIGSAFYDEEAAHLGRDLQRERKTDGDHHHLCDVNG